MPAIQGRLPIANDFEDISLFDAQDVKKWRSQRNSQSSQDSASTDGSQLDDVHASVQSVNSNISTPTLASDTSSLRSSMCSTSSPTLAHSQFLGAKDLNQSSLSHASKPSLAQSQASFHGPSYMAQEQIIHRGSGDHTVEKQAHRRRSVPALIDTTSMASLTIKAQQSNRSRKQREIEFDADQDDDIWPGDSLMFNVPMSPALYAQQKQMHQHQSHPCSSSSSSHGFLPMSDPRGMKFTRNKPARAPFVPPPIAHQGINSQQGHYLPNRRNNGNGPQLSLPSIHESGEGRRHADRAVNPLYGEQQRHKGVEQAARFNSSSSLPSLMSRRGSCISEPNSSIEGLDPDASDLTLEFYQLNEQERRRHSHGGGDVSIASLSMIGDDSLLPSPSSSSLRASEDSLGGRDSRRSSLTRPENLPPKSIEEEKKHMKEYEKLLREAAASEKRKQRKAEEEKQARAYQEKQDVRTWTHWLSKDGRSKLSSNIKWRGIPEKFRGAVWLQMASRCKLPAQLPPPIQSYRHIIVRDSDRLWPDCCIFGKGRPLHESLVYVVEQFLAIRPEIEYSFALVGIAGLMLLYLSEHESLTMMFNLVQPGSLIHSVLSGNERLASASYVSFGKIFRRLFVQLSEHFSKIGLNDSELLNPMIAGLFTTTVSSPEAAVRILDVFIFDGDSFLLRSALGILKVNEAWLYASKEEVFAQLQSSRPICEDTLMKCIRDVTKH